MELRAVKSGEEAATVAVEWLVQRFAKGVRTVGLSGGSTPKRVYELLGKRSDLPWAELQLYFGDERCVPPDDPESNYRMALAAFGRAVNLHRIHAERPDRDAAARDYEAILPERLDVLMLGVGEDGHTASLFPGGDAVHETKRRLVPVFGSKPPPWRITITPPVIAAAKEILVVAPGAGKVAAVRRALSPTTLELDVPSRLAAREEATWIVDAAVGSASAV